MNNTELTLDQLAEVAAAGLFINTNGSASYKPEPKLNEKFMEGNMLCGSIMQVMEAKHDTERALIQDDRKFLGSMAKRNC